jgi:uncharacterized cupin superfamily protein
MTEDGLFVCKALAMNVWADEWDEVEDWSGGGARSRRLVPPGLYLGATVYELEPGKWVIYHVHHGSEELAVILEGEPTLRTPEGERKLRRGDVVHFPAGPDGAHGLRNDTGGTVRYVMAGTRVSPEIAEYPDLKQVTGQSRHGIFFIHDVEEDA